MAYGAGEAMRAAAASHARRSGSRAYTRADAWTATRCPRGDRSVISTRHDQQGPEDPSVKIKQVTADGASDIDTAELFANKRVAMFSLPGAFTPTCSAKHLPGFVRDADALKAKGIDLIACLSVNDAFVMKAWAEDQHALGKIVMLADGAAEFSKALGIDVDLAKFGMGIRAGRGLIMAKNGVVESIEMEAPGQLDVSTAEACSLKLGA